MNTKRWTIFGIVVAALLVTAAIGTQVAYADTGTPPVPPRDGGGPRLHRLGPEALEAAAGVLGMTTDDLSAALQDGKTLEDLAEEKGVDIEAVRAAIQAAHKAQMLEHIKQAVAEGDMSQDKADWLIIGLENGYLDGPGRGFGFGPGAGLGRPRPPRGAAPQATQQP